MHVDLGTSETRKNQSAVSGHNVRTIQLRRHVGRQAAAPQGCRREVCVWRRRKEIPAEREKYFRLSVVHRLDRLDRVEPVIARRFKPKLRAQSFQKSGRRPLPNADGAIALNVAVPTHRAQTRTGLADLPAQQHQVDDLLNVRHCVAVLGKAHGPTEDRALRRHEDLRGLFNQISGYSRLRNKFLPANGF